MASPRLTWVNERLMAAQLAACDCAPDSTTLHQVVSPSTHDGLKAPALRFGDTRVMALLSCLCCYRHLFAGLTNKTLRELIAALIPGYSARQITYDLRRLRKASSAASPQANATKSPTTAGGSPSSSRRPTPGSSTHH